MSNLTALYYNKKGDCQSNCQTFTSQMSKIMSKNIYFNNIIYYYKTDLAKRAKEEGLDAIHDTVHEMARDEARHGKALKGLLDRYFK